ncbi:unnamed protein product [Colias eurytheme]|nr:unnamed protein product [Colias eurytheme]
MHGTLERNGCAPQQRKYLESSTYNFSAQKPESLSFKSPDANVLSNLAAVVRVCETGGRSVLRAGTCCRLATTTRLRRGRSRRNVDVHQLRRRGLSYKNLVREHDSFNKIDIVAAIRM